MIALVLALAILGACLIPAAIRADRADYHMIHRGGCVDCQDRP
jgi:hypothetical protein